MPDFVRCEIRMYRKETKSWVSFYRDILADRPEYPNWKQDIIDIAERFYQGWKVIAIYVAGKEYSV